MQQATDWHGILEGAGHWQTAKLDWETNKLWRGSEELPVKRLEWHLALAPRCIFALPTQPWKRELYAFLPVLSLGVPTLPKSHLNVLGFIIDSDTCDVEAKVQFPHQLDNFDFFPVPIFYLITCKWLESCLNACTTSVEHPRPIHPGAPVCHAGHLWSPVTNQQHLLGVQTRPHHLWLTTSHRKEGRYLPPCVLMGPS